MPPLASLQDLELRWLHAIACGESDLQDALAWFANDIVFGLGVVLLLGGLVAVTARGRSRLARVALAGVVALGLVHGARELLWRTLPRPRPGKGFTEAQILRGPIARRTCADHPDMWVERSHDPKEPSFPSSHVVTVAACAAALWAGSRWVGALAWLYALLVGWARLYWGKHWPTDVAGSLVLGALAGWAGWRIAGALLARRGPPAAAAGGGAPPSAAGVQG